MFHQTMRKGGRHSTQTPASIVPRLSYPVLGPFATCAEWTLGGGSRKAPDMCRQPWNPQPGPEAVEQRHGHEGIRSWLTVLSNRFFEPVTKLCNHFVSLFVNVATSNIASSPRQMRLDLSKPPSSVTRNASRTLPFGRAHVIPMAWFSKTALRREATEWQKFAARTMFFEE